MTNYIYKLQFLTPVRFGSDKAGSGLVKSSITCHADTFFSALSMEWMDVYGMDGFNEFISGARQDQFRISDLLPWADMELYLPKPVLPSFHHIDRDEERKRDKKAIKKMAYLPVGKFQEYLSML